jgi:hypothetical protein
MQPFQEDVLPVLQDRCVSCHAPIGRGYRASGLELTQWPDLTSYQGVQLRMPHSKKQLLVCDRSEIRIVNTPGRQGQ